MTSTVFLLLAVTLAVAAVDWVAVQMQRKAIEYVAKPLTMVVLIAAVAQMEPSSTTARTFFLVALVFSMIGDIFLMLPDRERWFVFGLASFLVGHLAYIPGLWFLGISPPGLGIGLAVVVVAVGLIGLRIVKGVREREPKLVVPVTVYMSVISVMVASAIATGRPIAIAGAVLFFCSDALIAWNGFIKEMRWGRMAIIVTYHLGQIGLALALI